MKLRNVIFLSKYVVENTEENMMHAALISIRLCGEKLHISDGKWDLNRTLHLVFHDIVRPENGLIIFNANHAQQIIKFIDRVKDEKELLVVHCNAGMSRSPSVACFVRDAYGINLPEKALGHSQDTFYRNDHVYKTLIDVYNKIQDAGLGDYELALKRGL